MEETESSDQNPNRQPEFKLKVEQTAPPILIHTERSSGKSSGRKSSDRISEIEFYKNQADKY